MSAVSGTLRTAAASAMLLGMLCSCAGSGSTQLTLSSLPTSPLRAPATAVKARVVIKIPARSSARAATRRPTYVSPSTQSITVQVDSASPTVQNLSSTSPDCSGAGTNYPYTCTVPISATPGSHTFTFITYDEDNAAGNQLSANSVVQTIAAGQSNTIAVTLAGVPVAVQVGPAVGASGISGDQSGLSFVGRQTQTLTIVPIDADGNVIVGPGAPTLAVSVTSPSAGSGIAIAPAPASANAYVLTSSDPGTATLAITATPASTLAGAAVSESVPLSSLADTTTLAGTSANLPAYADGTGSAALFFEPAGVAFDPVNGDVYVSDEVNCAIRQITSAAVVTTIAGGGPNSCGFTDGAGTAALFNHPTGIAYDAANGDLYVSDSYNCAIRQVTLSGTVTTLAGSGSSSCKRVDGTGTSASFDNPAEIAYDAANGYLYVADATDCAIRTVTTAGVVTTLAGGTCGNVDGTGTTAEFNLPFGVAYDPTDGNLYVADGGNCSMRKVTAAGVVTTIAGAGPSSCGYADGSGTAATFENVHYVAYSAIDGNLYVTDPDNELVREVTPAGAVLTIAGAIPVPSGGYSNGLGTSAEFENPSGIAYDSVSGSLIVTSSADSTIRVVEP